MNTENYYPDVIPSERLQMLQNNCDNAKKGETYQRPLTEDELTKLNQDFVQTSIVLGRLEDELDEWKEKYKGEMKPLKELNRENLEKLKTKQETVVDDLFEFYNHETSIATTYNAAGEFVSSRRMRPDEKQKSLYSLPKAQGE